MATEGDLKIELSRLSVIMSTELGLIFGTSVSCLCKRTNDGDVIIITNYIKDKNNQIEIPVDLDKLYIEYVQNRNR